MKRARTGNVLRGFGLALLLSTVAGCERAGEAPPSGGFENERVTTPAEVPPSAGEGRPAGSRPAPDSAAAPPDARP